MNGESSSSGAGVQCQISFPVQYATLPPSEDIAQPLKAWDGADFCAGVLRYDFSIEVFCP